MGSRTKEESNFRSMVHYLFILCLFVCACISLFCAFKLNGIVNDFEDGQTIIKTKGIRQSITLFLAIKSSDLNLR